MSKSFAFALLLFAASSFAISQAQADDPKFAIISTVPLMLDAVSATSVCGSLTSTPTSRQCLGANTNEIFANDTVSKLSQFVLGAGQLCGIDERGPRCWSSRGQFEKPVQALLAAGDAKRAQMSDDKICVPHADFTIHCHRPEQGSWVDAVKGSGLKDKYLRQIPPVEIFGPYKDLRDFDAGDNALCAIDGDTVRCDTFKHGNTASGNSPLVPVRKFKGAKAVGTTWNSICVLSDEGLDCSRGSKPEELVQFHLEGPWKTAVKLFKRGYDSVCGVDQDESPTCIRLGEKADEFTDRTPPELVKPEIRVLKFKAHADIACALVETRATSERSLLCGGLGSVVPMEVGKDAVDFAVSADANCTVNATGLVQCFYGTTHMDSPLPEDGSVAKSAGRCRWNSSRFHCATTPIATDFSEIRKVVANTNAQDSSLPCIIYENSSGIRSVKCYGSAEILATNAPVLGHGDTAITASYKYACSYGGPNTTCWGAALGEQQPPNLSNVKKIAFGDDFGCASDEFGFVCWGGRMDTRLLAVPQGLGDLDSVRDFGVGTNHVCAITRDKQLLCWGENDNSQIDVPPLTNPISLIVSGNTNCASSDEGVTCWGYRQDGLLNKGQLGLGQVQGNESGH